MERTIARGNRARLCTTGYRGRIAHSTTRICGDIRGGIWVTHIRGDICHGASLARIRGDIRGGIWVTRICGDIRHGAWLARIRDSFPLARIPTRLALGATR